MTNPIKPTALQAIAALREVRGKLLHTDKPAIKYLDDVIEMAADLGDVEECRRCAEYFSPGELEFDYCCDCRPKHWNEASEAHEARNEVFRDNVRGEFK
jgi:hypothetical protein